MNANQLTCLEAQTTTKLQTEFLCSVFETKLQMTRSERQAGRQAGRRRSESTTPHPPAQSSSNPHPFSVLANNTHHHIHPFKIQCANNPSSYHPSTNIMVHMLANNTLYHGIHQQLLVVCALTTPIINITSSIHKYGGG